MAILLTLIVTSRKATVTIYSDSKNAITDIEKSEERNNGKMWTHMKCASILAAIKQIRKQLKLKVSLIKVKAHSKNEGNDLIDNKIKITSKNQGTYNTIEINKSYLNRISLIPQFNNSIIDEPLKNIVKTINHSSAIFRWRTQNRTRKHITLEKARQIDWKVTKENL